MRKQLKKEREKESTFFRGLKNPLLPTALLFYPSSPSKIVSQAAESAVSPSRAHGATVSMMGCPGEPKSRRHQVLWRQQLRWDICRSLLPCASELKSGGGDANPDPISCLGQVLLFSLEKNPPNISGSWITKIVPRGYCNMNIWY